MSTTSKKNTPKERVNPKAFFEREYQQCKKELMKFNNKKAELFIGGENEFLTDLKTGRSYNLRLLEAFLDLRATLPCELDEIPEFCEFIKEDLTEYVLDHIDVPEFKRHRNTLIALSAFFSTLLEPKKNRPFN